MATIKNTTTGEITELECRIGGTDILADVLGGSGFEADGDGWLLDQDDINWWTRWAEREERITDAYEDANEEERRAYEEAISEWGHDLEALQDAQEVALGLAGYKVTVATDDGDGNGALLLEEHYANEADATARLGEIRDDAAENGGWGDGTVVTAWQILDWGAAAASIDRAPLA